MVLPYSGDDSAWSLYKVVGPASLGIARRQFSEPTRLQECTVMFSNSLEGKHSAPKRQMKRRREKTRIAVPYERCGSKSMRNPKTSRHGGLARYPSSSHPAISGINENIAQIMAYVGCPGKPPADIPMTLSSIARGLRVLQATVDCRHSSRCICQGAANRAGLAP